MLRGTRTTKNPAAISFVGNTGVEVPVDVSRVFDFSLHPLGATLGVNLVGLQQASAIPPCTIRWRVRIGDLIAVVDGDVVLDEVIVTPNLIIFGEVFSAVAFFTNIYTGPKVVQVTGESLLFNALGTHVSAIVVEA